jgi:hypothetical protein
VFVPEFFVMFVGATLIELVITVFVFSLPALPRTTGYTCDCMWLHVGGEQPPNFPYCNVFTAVHCQLYADAC